MKLDGGGAEVSACSSTVTGPRSVRAADDNGGEVSTWSSTVEYTSSVTERCSVATSSS